MQSICVCVAKMVVWWSWTLKVYRNGTDAEAVVILFGLVLFRWFCWCCNNVVCHCDILGMPTLFFVCFLFVFLKGWLRWCRWGGCRLRPNLVLMCLVYCRAVYEICWCCWRLHSIKINCKFRMNRTWRLWRAACNARAIVLFRQCLCVQFNSSSVFKKATFVGHGGLVRTRLLSFITRGCCLVVVVSGVIQRSALFLV